MLVRFLDTGYSLSDEDIKAESFDRTMLSDENVGLLVLMQQFLHGAPKFSFYTSGSTGAPKPIELSYEQLSYSAEQTLKYLQISKKGRLLLCISPKFIGGAMVAIRALIGDHDLDIVPANELIDHLKEHYQLASLVPIQVEKLLTHTAKVALIKYVLIGGAALSSSIESALLSALADTQQWYSTYGMTETASHVALRKLGSSHFHAIGDAVFGLDERSCLCISGTVTDGVSLQTNDVVDLVDAETFVWKGRYDLIINSGGFKVSPEKAESAVRKLNPNQECVITWIPDDYLGQMVVCLTTSAIETKQWEALELHRYEIPKKTFVIEKLPKVNEKIDRKAAHKLACQLSKA